MPCCSGMIALDASVLLAGCSMRAVACLAGHCLRCLASQVLLQTWKFAKCQQQGYEA